MGSGGLESGDWGQRRCGWGMGSEELGSRRLELGGLGSGVLRSVKLGPGELYRIQHIQDTALVAVKVFPNFPISNFSTRCSCSAA